MKTELKRFEREAFPKDAPKLGQKLELVTHAHPFLPKSADLTDRKRGLKNATMEECAVVSKKCVKSEKTG